MTGHDNIHPGTRKQFAAQSPYFPGTSWMVDGYPAFVDISGRAWWVGDATPMPIAWWNDGGRHAVEPIGAAS